MENINRNLINRLLFENMVRKTLVSLFATFILIWIIKLLWSRRKLYFYAWNTPGPFAFPLIGAAYLFITDSFLDVLQKQADKYPGITKFWMGPKLLYIVHDPVYVAKILTHPNSLEKADAYQIVENVFGRGIVSNPVRVWRHERKIMSVALNQNALDSFVKNFVASNKHLLNNLKQTVGKKDVDWNLFTTCCTFQSVCRNALNYNIDEKEIKKKAEDIELSFRKVLELASVRFLGFWYHSKFIYQNSSVKKEFDKYNNIFDNIAKTMIEYNKNNNVDIDTEEFDRNKKSLKYIQVVKNEPNLTEEQLLADVKTIIGASTDTTSKLIIALYIMMGMHPDIQEKVHEELMEVIGPDRNVESTDLPKLKLTERVIKETLRLFPAVAAFGRKAIGDIDLGDVVIPEGADIGFFPFLINRNPKVWKNPLKFDPDRFLPHEVAKRHPCSFITFSYGPRNCIGWKYALMNLQTMVASTLRELKVFTEYKSLEEIRLETNLGICFVDGPKIWFELRK